MIIINSKTGTRRRWDPSMGSYKECINQGWKTPAKYKRGEGKKRNARRNNKRS